MVKRSGRARAPDSPSPGEYMDVRVARPEGERSMRLITAVRIYYFSLAILVVGWIANLVAALRRPIFDWRAASGFSVLALIFIALSALIQARSRYKANPEAVIKIPPVRYVLAGLVVAVAVGFFSLGFYTRR